MAQPCLTTPKSAKVPSRAPFVLHVGWHSQSSAALAMVECREDQFAALESPLHAPMNGGQ